MDGREDDPTRNSTRLMAHATVALRVQYDNDRRSRATVVIPDPTLAGHVEGARP